MRARSGISVMFMTFIAVCILSAIFLTYYLHLAQQNLSASEAQRIYAEAAQESIDAFFYPPASEASSQGIPQTLVIHNRVIGTVIKYLFYRQSPGQELQGPLNGGDIILGSGQSIKNTLNQLLSDGSEILIVTERGSIFTAREGYFNVSLVPASIKIYPEENRGNSTLIVLSRNYEGRMRIIPDAGCEVEGQAEFSLTRNSIYTVPIECEPTLSPGIYRYSVKVEDTETGYHKKAVLTIEVREKGAGAEIPFSHVLVIIPENHKRISGMRNQLVRINFIVRGYDGYDGTLLFEVLQEIPVIGSTSFSPSSVTLTPWNTEMSVTLTFTITGSPRSEPYRIWIKAYEETPARKITRDADYFDLTIVQ